MRILLVLICLMLSNVSYSAVGYEESAVEKKLSKEKQLNRKYELAKEKQRVQREIENVAS